ncbi:MAG: hypothetical protein H6858_04375 [Rhodospirillales bacterium]|nr:hypothetical protein [Alphaproteobacteria bacterium]MCB1839765.1 hypothetical protein [Alphaproteobacteria bacterium]MCB9976821.1 hypothetical protein [Rhodospirillales bacterium]
MFALTNKPDMGARFYSALIQLASDHERGVDGMKVIQLMAGVLVENYFVFDEADQAMTASFRKLAALLNCDPAPGPLAPYALPPSHIIDQETERGRMAARLFFEDWMDCHHEFNDLLHMLYQHILIGWEDMGFAREESFRLLIECTKRAMAFEIAAQELCDVVIERMVQRHGWTLGDCIAALSGVAGRRLAISMNSGTFTYFYGPDLPENLEQTIHVMTQEAVRHGVPAGSNWRFGLPANDRPVNAPVALIREMEPRCLRFFRSIQMTYPYDQAVSCAKAAGRMIAVASGGELPEIEPAIAKPIAMSAMTETYKHVCLDFDMVSY